jgi:hypothetical protein
MMTTTAAQTRYLISSAATQSIIKWWLQQQHKPVISYHQRQHSLNYFTRLTVFMDAVHVFQAVLYYITLLPQHAPHPGTITYVTGVDKFKYSHVSRVKMSIVKRDTYHKNHVLKQNCKLKHSP